MQGYPVWAQPSQPGHCIEGIGSDLNAKIPRYEIRECPPEGHPKRCSAEQES
jgi:hypothetical protein